MVKALIRVCLSLALTGSAWAAGGPLRTQRIPLSESKAQTVYITKTGHKYHSARCRSLSRSKIPITVQEAMAGNYSACKVCKP